MNSVWGWTMGNTFTQDFYSAVTILTTIFVQFIGDYVDYTRESPFSKLYAATHYETFGFTLIDVVMNGNIFSISYMTVLFRDGS